MGTKIIYSAAFSVLMLGCALQSNSPRNAQWEQFQDYAQAICLGSTFDDDSVKQDFNRLASGIFEKSNISIDAVERLRDLIQIQLKKDSPSKHGGQVQSAKCLAVTKSSELREIFELYDPCKNKETWLNPDEYQEACG